MKILAEQEEEGLLALMGKTITVFACRYIYTGKLVGVNDTCVKLQNPAIVYETGPFSETNWKDVQKLPNDTVYISIGAIECFGVMK